MSSPSLDVFSLGMLLVNIISGKPNTVELPIPLKLKTVQLDEHLDRCTVLSKRCHDDISSQDSGPISKASLSELIDSQ